uniref:Uncharacterized protein n=1 Tax=Mycena chlorophos TaxID=658473 RepID=A0ABQ0L0W7_MYCCL|nr:predicted protein [Mycena chlorophos]
MLHENLRPRHSFRSLWSLTPTISSLQPTREVHGPRHLPALRVQLAHRLQPPVLEVTHSASRIQRAGPRVSHFTLQNFAPKQNTIHYRAGSGRDGTKTRAKAARPSVQFSDDMFRHLAIQSKLGEAAIFSHIGHKRGAAGFNERKQRVQALLTDLLIVPPPLLNAPVVPEGREESVQFRKYAL